jgi:hypothetical protein
MHFRVQPAIHRRLQARQTTTSSYVTLGYPGHDVNFVTSYITSINAFCCVPNLYQPVHCSRCVLLAVWYEGAEEPTTHQLRTPYIHDQYPLQSTEY